MKHLFTLIALLSATLAHGQFEAIRTLTPEQGQEVRRPVEAKIFGSPAEELPALEAELLDIFQASNTTLEGKQYACRMLRFCASEACVPALGQELLNPELSQFVRLVFQGLDSKAADTALLAALPQADEQIQIGIIGTLGQRGTKDAVSAIAPFLNSENADAQFAAITALGNIGGRKAVKALAMAEVKPEFSALSKQAQISAANGNRHYPFGIFSAQSGRSVSESLLADENEDVRCAALVGLAQANPKKASPTVLDALASDNLRYRNTAIGLLPLLPTGQLTSVRLGMKAENEVLLINELARRGATEAEGMLILATGNENEDIRNAAIRALGKVGGAEAIELLVADAPTDEVAYGALCELNATGTDEAIVEAMAAADDNLKVKYIECLSARQAKAALPALVELAKGGWSRTSAAAINGMANLVAGPDFASYAALILATDNKKKLGALEKSIGDAAQRLPDPNACALPLIEAYGKAKGEQQYAIIRSLGSIGGDAAKTLLTVSLESPAPEIRDAAVRGLCNWPTLDAADQLIELAETTDQEKYKVLALRGYIRLANTLNDEKKALPMCEKAAALTDRPAELKSIIACAKRFKSEEVINFIAPFIENPEVVDEAGQAMIEQTWHWKYKTMAVPHLERYIELTDNEQMKRYAQDAIDNAKN